MLRAGNAMNSPAMLNIVRGVVRIYKLCDVTLIRWIRLPWKAFVPMLSNPGAKKLLRNPRMQETSPQQEKHLRVQSFVMGQSQPCLKGQGRERWRTHIKPTLRRRLSRSVLCGGVALYWYNLDRVEIVKWVAKSMRPMSIVEDKGFKMLMKTSQPNYKLSKQMTVAYDVKHVFKKSKKRMKKLLQISVSVRNWIYLMDIILGTQWSFEFQNGGMNVTKPQSLCCYYHTLWAKWHAHLSPAWHGWSCVFL